MDSSEKEAFVPLPEGSTAPIEVPEPLRVVSPETMADRKARSEALFDKLREHASAKAAASGVRGLIYGAQPDMVLAKRELQAAAVEAIAAMSNVLDVLTENANAYATDPWRKERKEAHLKGIQNAIAALTKALG